VKSRSKRAVSAATALSMAAVGALTGPVLAANSGVASAQTVVMTQKYMIGTGTVSNTTASLQPDTAGGTADYTIGFTTPSALTKGTDNITLADPSGSTVFPGKQADYFVIDNTHPAGNQLVASATLATGGHSVTLGLSTSVGAGDSLTVYIVGATNPSRAGYYSIDVSTSQNPEPSSTAAYQVEPSSQAPTFRPAATPPLVNGTATYTVGAVKAATAIKAGDLIKVNSAGTSGANDDVAFPTSVSDYKVNDLTTASSSAVPSAVSVSGGTVTLKVTNAIAAGDELSVTMSGVRNPSTTQRDTISAWAPSTASPASAYLQIGTAVLSPSISLSQSGGGSTGVEYVVGFRAPAGLPARGYVTLDAPAGTSFSGASATLVDVNHPGSSANVPSSYIRTSATTGSSSANQVVVVTPDAITAGDQVFLEVQGVTNPSAGSYGGSAGDFTVATSADVIPVGVPAYVVSPAPAAPTASIELSSTAPQTSATYLVRDLKATSALAEGTSTIELKAATGTVLPTATSDYVIADVTNTKASAHPLAISGGGTNDVVLVLAADIASGDFLDLQVTDATNPASGDYALAMIGDLEAAIPPAAPPPVPPKPVPQPPAHHHPLWPAYLRTGALVKTPHAYYVVIRHQLWRVLGARERVAVRRHHHVSLRWTSRVSLLKPMHGHFVQVRYHGHHWQRWDGRLYRAQSLNQLVR
jgi:hypothetical protein